MKQQLRNSIVFNLLVLSALVNLDSLAYGTEDRVESDLPATTVREWRSQLDNFSAVITEIEVISTTEGIEIILNTANNEQLQAITSTEGNNLIIDVANARLELPEREFVRENPADGISAVTVTALDTNIIRVMVTGIAEVPKGEIIPTFQGLTISATPPVPVADTETPNQVIDIIVTAEKKPENIQDVPISITPITEQEAEDGDITSFRDIAENTPNFTTYTPSRNFVYYSIRGSSNFNFFARDPVAFYIDDVPYDYVNFLGVEVFDIERVETLRGPQSTLYGKNARAGVVNVITKPPSNEFEFDGNIGYGNFDNFDAQASVSSPIIEDKLFFRLSGSYENRDGYTENTFLNTDVDSQSGFTTRGKLLWTPTEDLSVAFNVSVDGYDDGPQPFVALEDETPFSIQQDFLGFNDLNNDTQSIRVNYEHPSFRLTSITARRFSDTRFELDSDIRTPSTVNIAIQTFDVDSTFISQEIRLQSPEEQEKFEWLLGGYLEFRDFNVNESGFITSTSVSNTQAEIDEDIIALFGQASYKPIEALTLTVGLRYETFDGNLDTESIFESEGFPPTVINFEDIEQDDDILLPRFTAQYRFNPSLMVYGSIARGYNPAGLNYAATTEELLKYDTETSTNYEIGLKSSWLDNRLQVNLAAFYSPVENFQLLATADEIPFSRQIANADVDIAGFELEVRATPLDGFDVIAGFGYVDATFDEFTNPFRKETIDGQNLPYSPEYTYNLALQYRADIGIFSRLELSGFGTSYFDNPNEFKQDPFVLVNARLGYERGNYGIYFLANNIFDVEHLTTAFDFGEQLGKIASYGAPATYGFQFRTKF